MTKLLDVAIARLRQLPADRQDEAAELLLSLIDQDPDDLQLSSALSRLPRSSDGSHSRPSTQATPTSAHFSRAERPESYVAARRR